VRIRSREDWITPRLIRCREHQEGMAVPSAERRDRVIPDKRSLIEDEGIEAEAHAMIRHMMERAAA
jgi:hypothetical protein